MPVRILVFVLTLVLCLAVQAPAWLIDSLLAQTTAQSLRLTQIEGTLWGGRGQLIVVDPVSRSAQPSPARARVSIVLGLGAWFGAALAGRIIGFV